MDTTIISHIDRDLESANYILGGRVITPNEYRKSHWFMMFALFGNVMFVIIMLIVIILWHADRAYAYIPFTVYYVLSFLIEKKKSYHQDVCQKWQLQEYRDLLIETTDLLKDIEKTSEEFQDADHS